MAGREREVRRTRKARRVQEAQRKSFAGCVGNPFPGRFGNSIPGCFRDMTPGRFGGATAVLFVAALCIIAGVLVLWSLPINAQTKSPAQTGLRARTEPQASTESPASSEPPFQTEPPAATESPARSEPPAYIEGLSFDDSAILSVDEFKAVAAMFVGTELTMDQLQRLVDALNRMYSEKGYLAQALIGPQTVDDGVVHVTLIEGRIGHIRIEDNRRTRTQFFTDRLSLAEGDLLQIDRLDDDVTYMNRTSDVAIRVELVPGADFGASDVVVFVQEPINSQFTLAVDGSGRAETGQYRTSLTWQTPSLTRYRDALSVSLLRADGTNVASVNYSHPIGRKGARLGVSYTKNEVEFLDGVYAPVGLRVNTRSGNVNYSVPLHVASEVIILLSVERHFTQSNTYLSGTRLTGSESQSTVVAMTVEYVTSTGTWTFNQGVRGGRAQTPNDSDMPYSKYNAVLQHVRPLARGSRLVARVSVQRGGHELLPSNEQFNIGGAGTVRGFDEGVASGDHGYAATVEYHWPWHRRITGYVFADNAAVYPYKGNEQPQTPEEYLTGVGVGFNWELGASTRTSTRFNVHYGHPLGRAEQSGQWQFRLQTVF